MQQYQELFDYLKQVEGRLLDFFRSSEVPQHFGPQVISDGVFSYIDRPAKRLRPAVLLMASGALGGDHRERLAVPAAAALELFHTWTLVHDDLIDNDAVRRGGPTVHEAARALGCSHEGLSEEQAADYGRDIAVLTGDVQHGWSIASLADLGMHAEMNPALVLKLIKHLQSYVLGNLVLGEVLDVQYGMKDFTTSPTVEEADIVQMLWLKSGVLYAFAGMAGALIGKNIDDFEDDEVQAITRFASDCGTAFQLQDDVLGINGDQSTLGKPVGSDIREGKKTVIVSEALRNATESQRKTILSVLGNHSASPDEVHSVTQLFDELDGIGRTKQLAAQYVEQALPHLDSIPASRYKSLLLRWAEYMLDRRL